MPITEYAELRKTAPVWWNQTARNALAHGLNAFFEYPDQWELSKHQRSDTAVDEIVRWATPMHCCQRVARKDVEVGGVTIRKGQRAGLFYSSANFDEEVFDRPFEFNILRNRNPHLAFGGNGAHCCIGANLIIQSFVVDPGRPARRDDELRRWVGAVVAHRGVLSAQNVSLRSVSVSSPLSSAALI